MASLLNVMQKLDSFVKRSSQKLTLHGVSRLSASCSSWRVVIWVLIFASAWVLFSVQLFLLLRSYFQYPKRTTTELAFGSAPFPDVTVCSHGALDFDAVHRVFEALEENLNEEEGEKSSFATDKFVTAIK